MFSAEISQWQQKHFGSLDGNENREHDGETEKDCEDQGIWTQDQVLEVLEEIDIVQHHKCYLHQKESSLLQFTEILVGHDPSDNRDQIPQGDDVGNDFVEELREIKVNLCKH